MPGPRGVWARLLLAAIVLASGPDIESQTLGGLRGQVTDERGWPMAGVSVAAASRARGISGRGAVTDDAGSFRIPSLPPASDYVVRATFPGFATVSMIEVRVEPSRFTTLRITLQRRTEYQEQIEVRAQSNPVSLDRPTGRTVISSEFIDSLPILGRNYQDLLTLAPGVTDVDGDGNPNIHGARDTDVVTLVDGVSTTDPLTGQIGAQLNIESIQEIEVITSGATAEFSRAQGGFANIITKSGGNDFQGTFKFFWRGSALDGDGAGIDDPSLHGGVGESGLRDLEFNDFMPFLSLEGPIVRDRAWFFTAHEYIRREDPVNALNSAFVTGTTEWREFAKVTVQVSPSHRIAFSVNYDPQEITNQGLNSFLREESGFTLNRGGLVLTLKASSILTPQVSLESSISYFDERPEITPTLNPDTNGNGLLNIDRNGNGFFEARERDPGEDLDGDGNFDIFEDFNGNRLLDVGEDLDRDGRVTPQGGCEGEEREDVDCDGHLDFLNEDQNGNGLLDRGEDIDGDGRLDLGTEDRNGNQILDDVPFPDNTYPFGRLTPEQPDREYIINRDTGVTSGPHFQNVSDRRKRFTLREDLGVYIPDYWGSHDIKAGLVVERESFDRAIESRSVLAPLLRNARFGPSTIRALLPAQPFVANEALNLTTGVYVQDSYKPFPNLNMSVGLRFDREVTDSFGYTPFEPSRERQEYNKLWNLGGGERGLDDFRIGNNDGLASFGFCADPIFAGNHETGGDVCKNYPFDHSVVDDLNRLRMLAISRMSRHHTEAGFTSRQIASLFPDVLTPGGEIDAVRLAQRGVLAQQREAFRLTNNNLAPRLSISWDPWSNGRSKVFATWGRYYDKLFLNTIIGEEGPDIINRYYLLDADGVAGGVPNRNLGNIISKAPPSSTQVDRGLQTPYSDEFTIGFEREIAPEVALSITYIDRHYRDQLQDIDVNHTLRLGPDGDPLDQFGQLPPAGTVNASQSVRDGRPDLYIYNFFFNQVLRVGNFNQARYKGIELAVTKRLSRRWELQGSYTYSRAVGEAEDFESRLGNDPSTVESEFGYLEFDQRHVVKLNAVTFLPGDWMLGLSSTWSSGLPFSTVSRFFALDNVGYQQFRTRFGRTERVGSEFKFRDMRRNSQRNHAFYDINMRARKAVVFGKYAGAIFLEVFNLLNTDDLRILTIDPNPEILISADTGLTAGSLQIDGTRRFGRRIQVGFQIDF
ncbi:MAG: TonB-dependent receptor [Acidobacteria bacterium]|nr:TonB-dependent receptor [Acidobacteriota bacterium]